MSALSRKMLQLAESPGARLVYGVAASSTTVYVGSSTVAVTVPSLLATMTTGDYVAIVQAGADMLIIGQVSPSGGGVMGALNDLTDVTAGSPVNNDVLSWDTASSKWINEQVNSTTTDLVAKAGGVDGGILLGDTWGGYVGMATEGMTAGSEYMIMSNGTTTLVSGGSGGSTNIRSGANGTGGEIVVSSTGQTFAGISSMATARVGDGSAGAPTYSFTSDTNTGMYRAASDTIGWSLGGLRKMQLSPDRLYLFGGTGATSYIGPINTTHFYMYTASTDFYFNKEIRVDSGNIGSHNENLNLRDSGTTCATLTKDTDANGSMVLYQNSNSTTADAGKKAGLRIVPRSSASVVTGGISGITLQTTYSTDRHIHMRVFYASGDQLTMRNYENTAWVSIAASSFVVSSSAKNKERIRTGRTERGLLDYAIPGPRRLAFSQLRKLRPVLFDDKVQERLLEWGGCLGHDRKVWTPSEDEDGGEVATYERIVHDTRDECTAENCFSAENMRETQHHCDGLDWCNGTAEWPCDLVGLHVDRPGFIAEEVAQIFPKAVNGQADGDELGIDYAVLVTELVNTVQHMLEDRDEMRSRMTKQIWARRKIEHRITLLEAAGI